MKKLFAIALLALGISMTSNAQIVGPSGACAGTATRLYDSLGTGGTWTSSNMSVATIGSSTGIVYAVSAGTTMLTLVSSSGFHTMPFTVSPMPGSILGVTSLTCGGTSTLSCTPSGGSWSSSTSGVATVSASTGVVFATGPGTSFIHYTMGTGCSSTNSVTVTGTGTFVDSLVGASTLCVGSTTTITCTTTGGVWTSSSTSTATVSSTGIVTGVSTGSVNITYTVSGSCGSAYSVHRMTITSGASAGTISGSSSVATGSSIALTSSVSGGTWSSSSTSIATVDASTGTVYGISAGTVTISYTVVACGSTVVATYTVTVVPFTGISGDVLFGSGAYTGSVKVWLIRFNPSTLNLYAFDSLVVTASGTSVHYSFPSVTVSDSIRVKAHALDTLHSTTGYLPTYHNSSTYWHSATVFYHTAGVADINKNINMGYGTITAGPGFIAGNVTTGANKGTAGDPPAVGLLVYVVNSANVILQQTVTDASGNYSFSNLPVGETYKIYPEAINYTTTAYTSINLTTAAPSKTAANFIQRTISKVITPILSAVSSIDNNSTTISAFPNPASNTLNIQWEATTAEKAVVTLTDLAGRVVSSSSISLTAGSGKKQIDLSDISNGMYLISVESASFHYNNKVQIAH